MKLVSTLVLTSALAFSASSVFAAEMRTDENPRQWQKEHHQEQKMRQGDRDHQNNHTGLHGDRQKSEKGHPVFRDFHMGGH